MVDRAGLKYFQNVVLDAGRKTINPLTAMEKSPPMYFFVYGSVAVPRGNSMCEMQPLPLL